MNWIKVSGLLVATSFLSACSGDAEETSEIVRPVRTQVVELSQSNFALDLAGEVQARYVSSLGFQVPGKLINRYVDVGQRVKQGQLLAKIDGRDYELQLEQANAKLNVTQANYQRAKAELVRFEKLLKQKLISPSQHESQLNATKVAEAQVKEAQSAVNIARNRMQYTELHADSSGVVTQIYGEVGQVLAAGQRLIEVARPKFKEVSVEVPESLIQGISVEDNVAVSIWALPNKAFKGHVREIAPTADKVTRTYLAKVAIVDEKNQIELGMSARINFEKNTGAEVAQIPPTAILIHEKKPHVWVVDKNAGKVHLKPVKISDQLANDVIVFEGLVEGDLLVTAGVHRLHEGQAVSLLQP